MRAYNVFQQIRILNSCKSATELLVTKENLQEMQPIARVTQLVYDRMMKSFFEKNKIVWLLQN
jgi:hypothetical protein